MSSSGKKERSNFGGFFGEYGTKSQSMVDKKLVVRKEKRESEEHDVSDDESMSDSQIRQNFDVEIEKKLNKSPDCKGILRDTGLIMSSSGKKERSNFGGFFGEYGTKSQSMVDKKLVVRKEKRESEEHDVSDDELMSDSQIRQNFDVEIEKLLNKQINLELQACYNYQSMGAYFGTDSVALPNFSKFFRDSSLEERQHADDMMKYINKRGGCVVLDDIPKPDVNSWGTGLGAMQTALDLEKCINQVLLELHKLAIEQKDPHTEKFVKKYLCEQVKMIKLLGDHVTNLKRVGPGLGVYLFGRHTLKTRVQKRKLLRRLKLDSSSSSSSDSDSDVE